MTGPVLTSPTSKPLLPRWALLVLIALWLATVGNIALWEGLDQLGFANDLGDFLLMGVLALIIASALVLVMSLSCWPGTATLVVVLLLLMASFGAYFMRTYGVVIDTTMMVNALQTNAAETRDLLTLNMLGYVVAIAGIPLVVVYKSKALKANWRASLKQNAVMAGAACVIMVLLVLAMFQSIASLMRNHTEVRFLINPLNSLWAFPIAVTEPLKQSQKALVPVGTDAVLLPSASPSAKPPLLVLVLGETVRSGNLAINGYERPTTPHLSRLKAAGEISSFTQVWSCGTSTATSLPCMFSPWGKSKFESLGGPTENLVDVLQRAGLAVLWLENQSGCKGICARIPTAVTTNLKTAPFCDTGECFDEIMLQDLDARIAALGQDRYTKGVVVILHQMGSHGPAYSKRSPAALKKFAPECKTSVLQDCSRQEVVNAYDNTVVYLDHFLNQTLAWQKLRANDMAMSLIYMSDHGESLGENNIYLHGLPYAIAPDVQKRVPWITWLSPQFQERSGIQQSCLNSIGDQRFSHDNLFHTVVGMLGIQTNAYDPARDAFAKCVKR
jgi:lipid A ethanolaminephosphotransferase